MRKRILATIFVAALLLALPAQSQHVKTLKLGSGQSLAQ
jgi:hypothetical protein